MLALCIAAGTTSCSGQPEDDSNNPSSTQNISSMDSLSYALGVLLATNLPEELKSSIDRKSLTEAFGALLDGNATMTAQEADMVVRAKMMEIKEEQTKAARAEGEAFLKDNATKEGIVTTASGLQYRHDRIGTGASPSATDQVKVDYRGTLLNGEEFDSSYSRGEPISFPLNGVIRGWTEGLQLMKEGGKTTFYIPYDLAYGERGSGGAIPPYSTLIFEVELHQVNP